jgi:hypothetical protein
MRRKLDRRLTRRMKRALALGFAMLGLAGVSGVAFGAAPPASGDVVNPAPAAAEWAALAKLPDWSGVWTPAPLVSQGAVFTVPPAWTTKAAERVARMQALDKAGTPDNIYINCLPEGMPSFDLMTLNAVELLFTPGRVTLLSEFDGNRLRRIYTDGRGHPDDPDLTFSGHSIGRWEGDTLVVDTVGIKPQAFIPLAQDVGVPNNGDLHTIERIHLIAPDKLQIDLTVIAPHVLTRPWTSSRVWTRSRLRKFDIVEASCREGDFVADTDEDGFAIFHAVTIDAGGAPLAPEPGAPK